MHEFRNSYSEIRYLFIKIYRIKIEHIYECDTKTSLLQIIVRNVTFIRKFSCNYVKIKEGRQFKLGLQFEISLASSNDLV